MAFAGRCDLTLDNESSIILDSKRWRNEWMKEHNKLQHGKLFSVSDVKSILRSINFSCHSIRIFSSSNTKEKWFVYSIPFFYFSFPSFHCQILITNFLCCIIWGKIEIWTCRTVRRYTELKISFFIIAFLLFPFRVSPRFLCILKAPFEHLRLKPRLGLKSFPPQYEGYHFCFN